MSPWRLSEKQKQGASWDAGAAPCEAQAFARCAREPAHAEGDHVSRVYKQAIARWIQCVGLRCM